MSKRFILIVLDGWGIGRKDAAYSATAQAATPNMDGYVRMYPYAELQASGSAVGLPDGQMGNSEVGHLHLGAGRVVSQTLLRIHRAIDDGRLMNHRKLTAFLTQTAQRKQALHLMGLLSTGGVHAHTTHLFALLDACRAHHIPHVYVHAFLDGRDMPPCSCIPLLKELQQQMAHPSGTQIHLSTLIGRYYAMDRNRNWTRTQTAYDALVHGQGTVCPDPLMAVANSYEDHVYDEFVRPVVLHPRRVAAGDAVLFFNFRPDRNRQLIEALTPCGAQAPPNMVQLPLDVLTLTQYSSAYDNIPVVFEKEYVTNTLGEVLADHKKSQLRLAETEKYPHVTYFFSGRKQERFALETRIMCPSPDVATYDLAPQMSAAAITNTLLERFAHGQLDDFICLNFANPDMVGHTGNLQAAIQACATVDACLGQVVAACRQAGYGILIVADHGNAEIMRTADGTPHTAHTTSPVPCVLIDNALDRESSASGHQLLQQGGLANIAPTILGRMRLPIPHEMNAERLD